MYMLIFQKSRKAFSIKFTLLMYAHIHVVISEPQLNIVQLNKVYYNHSPRRGVKELQVINVVLKSVGKFAFPFQNVNKCHGKFSSILPVRPVQVSHNRRSETPGTALDTKSVYV